MTNFASACGQEVVSKYGYFNSIMCQLFSKCDAFYTPFFLYKFGLQHNNNRATKIEAFVQFPNYFSKLLTSYGFSNDVGG